MDPSWTTTSTDSPGGSATPTPEIPAEPAPPGSPVTDLWRVFTAPRSLFESLRERPRFWLPLLVVIVVQVAAGVLMFRSEPVREHAIAKMEERGMTPDQVDRTERAFESPLVLGLQAVTAGLAGLIIIFVCAGLAYFVGSLLLGAQATFRHYVCASALASVVGLLDHIYITVQVFVKGTTTAMAGLGAFLPGEPNAVIYAIDALTDPLSLWSWFIMALGIGVMTRKGLGVGILATLVPFFLAVALRTASLVAS
jgi:hypothetical protein